MDDYMFEQNVSLCKTVQEVTSYLEIFNYSDSSYNTIEEHNLTLLTQDDFDNFLERRGAFAPPNLPGGVKLLNGVRIVLQKNAKQPDTFSPHYISLKPGQYTNMVRKLKLPFRAIEGTSIVGPFFWAAYDQDDDDPHLQIIMRKSDVRKKGKTRGWEIMLSHSFVSGITTGFVKGTPSSDIVAAIEHLKSCALQIGHPMLLPVIILSHDLSSKTDQKQRDARDWLRKLENAVSMRNEIEEKESYVDDGMVDFDAINRDLVECHSQVLWKRPQAYLEIIREMKLAMDKFWKKSNLETKSRQDGGILVKEVLKVHKSMVSRLDFYKMKLRGVENYAHTTLERLNIQRSALYNIIAVKESKLNLEMAAEQRRLAHASKRDGTAMKTLSFLGAIFLPGTYLASVFSMTFFNFQNGLSDNGNGNGSASSTSDSPEPQVSPELWIYFAVTIPVTLIIVGSWWFFDRRREKRYAREDRDIEKQIDKMEMDIMATMRKRTMSKASTWNTTGTRDT